MNMLFRLFGHPREQTGQVIRMVRRVAHAGFVVALALLMLALPWKHAQAQPLVIATISFGTSRAGVIGANPVTDKVYAAREDDPSIAVIDANTNTVMTTIPTSGFHSGLAVDPVTNKIYVSQQFVGAVKVIDGSTDTVVADFPVPGLFHTIGDIAVNPATNTIYVIRADNDDISVHDGITYTQLATVSCSGGCHSGELGVNPTTNRIYVTNPGSNLLTVIDGSTNTVVTSIPVGDQPRDVAVNPVTNRVYVTNLISNTVSVIDGETNLVLDTVTPGTDPLGITVNPETNRIYVANFTSKDVSIIDGQTDIVLATVPVGVAPAALAVTPNLSRVYVSQGDHNISVLEDLIPYNFNGFFAPVDNPGAGPTSVFNVAKAGSAIPVKFSLSGDQGLNIFATGYPVSQQIKCDASGTQDLIEQTVTSGSSSLSYEAVTDQYVYVWKTEKVWANTCRQFVIQLKDGTRHLAYFTFRK